MKHLGDVFMVVPNLESLPNHFANSLGGPEVDWKALFDRGCRNDLAKLALLFR